MSTVINTTTVDTTTTIITKEDTMNEYTTTKALHGDRALVNRRVRTPESQRKLAEETRKLVEASDAGKECRQGGRKEVRLLPLIRRTRGARVPFKSAVLKGWCRDHHIRKDLYACDLADFIVRRWADSPAGERFIEWAKKRPEGIIAVELQEARLLESLLRQAGVDYGEYYKSRGRRFHFFDPDLVRGAA